MTAQQMKQPPGATTPDPLPPEIEARLKRDLREGESLLLAASADLDDRGDYGIRWFAATDRRVMVFTDESAPALEAPLDELSEFKAEALVGQCVLRAKRSGHPLDLLRFTNSHHKKFARIAKFLEDFKKQGKAPDLESLMEEDRLRCPKCGRVLPEWSEICLACMKKGKTVRRLMGYLRPFWKQAALALVLTLIGTGASLIPPVLTKTLIDKVVAPKLVPAVPILPMPERMRLLVVLVGAMFGFQMLQAGLSTARGYIMAWLAGRVTFSVSAELYHALQHMRLRFFDKKQVGSLMSRMTRDTDYLWGLIVEGSQALIVNALLIVGIGIIMVKTNWALALLVLLPVPAVIAMTMVFWRRLHRRYHRLWQRWSKFAAYLQDVLSGIRVVKAFAQEKRERDRFHSRGGALYEAFIKADQLWGAFFPWMTFLTGLGALLVWWRGGLDVLRGQTTLGELTMFLALLSMFYGPLQMMSRVIEWAQRAITAAERIFEVLDTQPEPYEAPDAVPMPRISGTVEFEHITFGYDKHKPVLQDVDLKVEPGEMIGLVGRTGAGKSTTINLICRFYDVDEGAIRIDGIDVRKIRLKDLREQIGVVLQDTFLFHGTIAENVAYAKPDATREEIIRAARAANAHEFILRFPDGYDSQVGERGFQLSAGERQRVTIARAILHDPRILIFDEATASVDTETERKIQDAVAVLIKGRTTFAIAHRLSTLRHANRLVVLQEGKIEEVGTHDELMEKEGGVYRKLVEMQTELARMKAVSR